MLVKYYLVALGRDEYESPENFYWMVDKGEKWLNIAKRNILKPKSDDDIIKAVVETNDLTALNWSETPLYDDGLTSGWLSRDGRFYGCPSKYHDTLAYCVLGITVADLENTGWVRIYSERHFTCLHRISEEQRNWLSSNYYRVPDYF
ncbi:MAG: hypothetical protein ACE5GY_07635 [Thermodesulfobacteriota bacterium]